MGKETIVNEEVVIKELQKKLEFLGKNRRVNDSFKDRLEKVGFEICYGSYSYWNNCEYVQIGEERIYLVKERTTQGQTSCVWRRQIEVIEDIIYYIKKEEERLQIEDRKIEKFFECFK